MSSTGWSDEAMKAWQDAQQRYWAGLAGSSQSDTTGSPPPDPLSAPAWVQGLGQWWSDMTPDAPPQIHDVLSRVLDMGKVYLGLAEQVYGNTHANPSQPNLEAWMRSLESSFSDWQAKRGQAQTASPLGFGNALFDGWQQVVGRMQGMDAFKDVGTGGLHLPNTGLWQEHLQKALGTPTFGFTRESQDRLKGLAKLALAYQQALDAYSEAFAKQGAGAVQSLRVRVQQLAADGKAITSLRALYDLWVDVSEEAYGRFAISDEYQVVYGDLVNSFLALKQGSSQHLDKELKAAGLPVKADLHAAYKGLHELRQENHTLRSQLKAMENRLAQLESRLLVQPASREDFV